jgi:5-methylcytosine-specific restriction enzyme A
MVKRPCLTCGVLIVSGNSHCPAHAKTTARGYGSAWQKKAKAFIANHPWCCRCHAIKDLTVDHIVPKAKGGSDGYDNLRVLCRSCNSAKRDRRT